MQHLILNKYSAYLLAMLNWPKATLLIFGTNHEALICLKSLFPNPTLVEAENMRIRIQVMPFEDIDWNFQLSFDGFRNFPARPLERIISLKSLESKEKNENELKARKRKVIEIVTIDSDSENEKSKKRKY